MGYNLMAAARRGQVLDAGYDTVLAALTETEPGPDVLVDLALAEQPPVDLS